MRNFPAVAGILLSVLIPGLASASLIAIECHAVSVYDGTWPVVVNRIVIDIGAEYFLSAELLVEPDGEWMIFQDPDGTDLPPPWTASGMVPQSVPPPPQADPRDLSWDTYVSGGSLSWCSYYDPPPPPTGGVGATGLAASIVKGAVDIGGAVNPTFNEHKIDVTWTPVASDASGDLVIAQITLDATAQGTWAVRLAYYHTEGTEHIQYGEIFFGLPIMGGCMGPIPEPSTWVLMVCGAMGLLGLRRRS